MSLIIGKIFVNPEHLDLENNYALSLPAHQLAYDRYFKVAIWISMADLGHLLFTEKAA